MIDGNDNDNTEVFDLPAAARRAQHLLTPGVKDVGGDPEGEVHHPNQLDTHNSAMTVLLCKDMADILVKNFPGWAWVIQPDERGGVVNVFNLHCHESLGYTIHGDLLDNAKIRRREVLKAGGEILERFKMPHKMDPVVLQEAPRDARGMLIPDLAGLNMVSEKRNAEIALKLHTGEWEIVDTPEGRYIRSKQ